MPETAVSNPSDVDASSEHDAESSDSFHHASADEGFKNRVDSIFGCLGSLEKKYEDNVPKEENVYTNDDLPGSLCQSKQPPNQNLGNHTRRLRGAQYRGRGRGRGRMPNKVPDHIINPEKWKKYSLEDDGTVGVAHGLSGDQLNKKIAMDFIGDLKKRNAEDNKEEAMDTYEKISFTAPTKSSVSSEEKSSSEALCLSSSHGSKARVMKTYHIGEKRFATHTKKPINQVETKSREVVKEVELDYLDKKDDVENIEQSKSVVTGKNENSDTTIDTTAPSNTFVSRKKKDRKGIRKRIEDSEDQDET